MFLNSLYKGGSHMRMAKCGRAFSIHSPMDSFPQYLVVAMSPDLIFLSRALRRWRLLRGFCSYF